jgi:putative phosphoesterase
VLRIGVISDTHGLLRPEVEQRLAGVAHIVHAGDIGSPNVIAGLQRIAPVVAIRGNVDTGHWTSTGTTSNRRSMVSLIRAVVAFVPWSTRCRVAPSR